jgi:hypothetical protein
LYRVEGATYIYRPIDGFAKIEFVEVFYVEGATYIYRPIDGFVKVEFLKMF